MLYKIHNLYIIFTFPTNTKGNISQKPYFITNWIVVKKFKNSDSLPPLDKFL